MEAVEIMPCPLLFIYFDCNYGHGRRYYYCYYHYYYYYYYYDCTSPCFRKGIVPALKTQTWAQGVSVFTSAPC